MKRKMKLQHDDVRIVDVMQGVVNKEPRSGGSSMLSLDGVMIPSMSGGQTVHEVVQHTASLPISALLLRSWVTSALPTLKWQSGE